MLFEHKPSHARSSCNINFAPILFNGFTSNRVHLVKYLGILIDDKLSWSDYIDSLISKISSLTGILYRIGHYLPFHCKRSIYFALAHSHLVNCIEVYANVSPSLIKPLMVKCNRLLRLMLNKPLNTPLQLIYSPFNILPINLLFKFYTCKFIHRCLWESQKVPLFITEWFVRVNVLHSHNTRHSNNFFVQSRCNPQSILFYGPSM